MKINRETLEEEGWKHNFSYATHVEFEKGDVYKDKGRGAFLSWYPHSNVIRLATTDEGYNTDGPNYSTKFAGKCETVEELREICGRIYLKI